MHGLQVLVLCVLVTSASCHRSSHDDVVCWGKFDIVFSTESQPRGLSLPDVVELESSGHIVCGHTLRGLWCVGSSERGIANSKKFVPFTRVEGARSVMTGTLHACAIAADGTGRCWGFNDAGELGDGERTVKERMPDVDTPVVVRDITDIVQFSLGTSHTCARVASGAVYCWGRAGDGQLGVSVSTDPIEPTPGPVLDLNDAIDLATAKSWNCAVRRTGKVACWGTNDYGVDPTPKEVSGVTDAIQVVLFRQGDHLGGCALRRDGSVACFNSTAGPPRMLDTRDVTQLAAGSKHMCTLHRDSTVTCYGDNGVGQRGVDRADGVSSEVPELGDVVQLAAGDGFTCARRRR